MSTSPESHLVNLKPQFLELKTLLSTSLRRPLRNFYPSAGRSRKLVCLPVDDKWINGLDDTSVQSHVHFYERVSLLLFPVCSCCQDFQAPMKSESLSITDEATLKPPTCTSPILHSASWALILHSSSSPQLSNLETCIS